MIREMNESDYEAVLTLWQNVPGIGLSSADSRANIAKYLARNPGHSLVAEREGEIVAAVLAGHDGRRGFLHHLAVKEEFRNQGLGSDLAASCLKRLKAEGIDKCHLFAKLDNVKGQEFWGKIGWLLRGDICIYSRET